MSEDTPESSNSSPSDADLSSTAEFDLGSLRDAFMDQVASVDLGEDGSIEMVVPDYSDAEADAPQDAEPEYEARDDAGDSRDTRSSDGDAYEERYKEVQSWATKVSQENKDLRDQLQQLLGRVDQMNRGREQEPVDEGPQLEPDTQAALDAYIEKKFPDLVTKRLGVDPETMAEMQSQFKYMAEIREAMAKHEDFMSYQPVIHEIFNTMPDANLTFEQAYNLAKRFYSVDEAAPESSRASQSVEAPETAPAAAPRSDAPVRSPQSRQADLREKAARLGTLESMNHGQGRAVDNRREINTPFDAMRAALEEVGD